jgi:hypothetical protein
VEDGGLRDVFLRSAGTEGSVGDDTVVVGGGELDGVLEELFCFSKAKLDLTAMSDTREP